MNPFTRGSLVPSVTVRIVPFVSRTNDWLHKQRCSVCGRQSRLLYVLAHLGVFCGPCRKGLER